jgi:tetratricopeptide (TPR) repeat protein
MGDQTGASVGLDQLPATKVAEVQSLIRKVAQEAAENAVKDNIIQQQKSAAHEWSIRLLLLAIAVSLAIVPIFLLLDRYQIVELVGAQALVPASPQNPAKSATPAGIADMVGILIPVLTVLVAFFLGSTGLKRLQLYDVELSQNRRERREEMESLRAQLAHDMDRAENSGREAAVQQAAVIRAEVLQASRKVVEDTIEDLVGTLTHVRTSADKILETVNSRIASLEWVLNDSDIEDVLSGESVSSMGELHSVITELFQNGKEKAAKKLFERYFGPDRHVPPSLRGTADDFFNTATQLAMADLEPLAYRASEGGLHFYPENPDLLSYGMKYALVVGERDRAQQLYDRARALPDTAKNWRVWVFMGDYLEDTASAQAIEAYYVADYLGRYFDGKWQLLPSQPKDAMDERMFAKLARFYERRGREQDAIMVTRLALKHIERVPQCAGVLSDLLLSHGKLEEAITLTDRAIWNDAQDQSHVNISALLMRKGNAYDSLFFRSADGGAGIEVIQNFARRTLSAYGRCLTSNDMIRSYPRQIESRMNAIIGKLEELGVPAEMIRELIPDTLAKRFLQLLPSGASERPNRTEQEDPSRLQEWLLRIKEASTKAQPERGRLLQAVVAEIDGSDLETQASMIFQHAVDRFETDEEEEDFVECLKKVILQLQG